MMAQLSSFKQTSKLFTVALIGASVTDLEIFTRIFGITRYRQRRYELLVVNDQGSSAELAKAKDADIHVVNLQNQNAVLCWQRIAATIPAEQRKPVLKISKATPSSEAGAEFTISWPINPAKMLQVLDNYTIRHLHYYPEFAIGSEVEPSSAVLKNIKAISVAKLAQLDSTKTNKAIRVLIADDSLAVRRQLKMEFDMMDATLNSVENGEAAVKAAETEKYDVIFLDVVMPGIDGYAACKSIRRTKLNRNTPVVMLTSRSSNFDKLKGILAGCDTYLTKPINHSEFTEVTQKHLNKSMENN
jgi:two-component system cell cycle response regulator